jgi:hypothetical protein
MLLQDSELAICPSNLLLIEVTVRLSLAMMRGRSGGATRNARTRYNVQSCGKWVGVENVKRVQFVKDVDGIFCKGLL